MSCNKCRNEYKSYTEHDEHYCQGGDMHPQYGVECPDCECPIRMLDKCLFYSGCDDAELGLRKGGSYDEVMAKFGSSIKGIKRILNLYREEMKQLKEEIRILKIKFKQVLAEYDNCKTSGSDEEEEEDITLEVRPTSKSLPYTDGTFIINVSGTCGNWTASTTSSWMTLSPTSGSGNGSILVTYEENTGNAERQGEIIVSGCAIKKRVSVTQAKKEIEPTPPTPTFDCDEMKPYVCDRNEDPYCNDGWAIPDNHPVVRNVGGYSERMVLKCNGDWAVSVTNAKDETNPDDVTENDGQPATWARIVTQDKTHTILSGSGDQGFRVNTDGYTTGVHPKYRRAKFTFYVIGHPECKSEYYLTQEVRV